MYDDCRMSKVQTGSSMFSFQSPKRSTVHSGMGGMNNNFGHMARNMTKEPNASALFLRQGTGVMSPIGN